MKAYFSEEQKQKELNKIELEEDEVIILGEFIEGSGKSYIIRGSAIIDGETYRDFEVEFELVNEPNEETIEDIMEVDWEWYDYLIS